MKIQRVDSNLSFKRKPNAKEMQVYTSSINQGLNVLGKQVDVILHNASAPAVAAENTGIGSLFSRTSAEKLFPFLKEHGIKGIQQEPNGLRKVLDNSPYAPESNAKNIFMIPLEKLASEEYGNILSKKTFDAIVKNNPNAEEVNYPYVRSMYDVALREAFRNSKDSAEFLMFKAAREGDFEQSAIYRVLAKMHGNDDFIIWGNRDEYTASELELLVDSTEEKAWSELDKTLFVNDSPAAKARIAELKKTEDYDYYIFQQMILEKESEKSNLIAQQNGIKIIGDSPVAPTAVECWVNQHLFLKGLSLGCPPDYFSESGQRWGFPYYNPDEIFKPDGSLGKAGEAIKKKYEEYFASFKGGIRIDHIIGLIDPFIYTNNSKNMTSANSGRIFSLFSGKYRKKDENDYAAILSKIIIPAAEKHGIDKSAIICEDLGDKTPPTARVMEMLKLSGVSVTQFDHRGAKAPADNVIMLGSHDNTSFLEFVEDLFNFNGNKDKEARFLRKTRHLAIDTVSKYATNKEKNEYLDELRSDKLKFIAASFAELFTSPAKKVQFFFADFWGMGKTYNRPGTTQGNWALRLGDEFENDYYKAAAEGKAPNLPKIIAQAIKHKGLGCKYRKLMQDLEASAKIISEK